MLMAEVKGKGVFFLFLFSVASKNSSSSEIRLEKKIRIKEEEEASVARTIGQKEKSFPVASLSSILPSRLRDPRKF